MTSQLGLTTLSGLSVVARSFHDSLAVLQKDDRGMKARAFAGPAPVGRRSPVIGAHLLGSNPGPNRSEVSGRHASA